jgi:hypothetical protein
MPQYRPGGKNLQSAEGKGRQRTGHCGSRYGRGLKHYSPVLLVVDFGSVPGCKASHQHMDKAVGSITLGVPDLRAGKDGHAGLLSLRSSAFPAGQVRRQVSPDDG